MRQTFIFKDYYRLLGVGFDANTDEIKSAFRKLARLTHPDITGHEGDYSRFVLAREAYDTLMSPRRRAQYDRAWRMHHGALDGFDEDSYLGEIVREFSVRESGEYRDEWEYFVRSPDDYLGFFESAMRVLAATALAAGAGVVAPIAVFAGGIVMAAFLALAFGVVAGALVTSSLSSVAGIIMAIMLYRRVEAFISKVKERVVALLAGIVIRPLKGIPLKTGRWILYANYGAVLACLGVFGYMVISSIYGEFFSVQLDPYRFYMRTLCIMLVSVSAVLAFTYSVLLIFEVIREALDRYPPITYSRVKIKTMSAIPYMKMK